MKINEAVKVNADTSYRLVTSDEHYQEKKTRQMCEQPPGDTGAPDGPSYWHILPPQL